MIQRIKKKNYNKIFLISGVVLTGLLVSCGGASKSIDSTNIKDAESPFILPLHEDIKECFSCDEKKPIHLDQFKTVLIDSKLQQYKNGGKSREEFKKLDTFCDDTIFKVCGDAMVLQATDDKNDRVEFRQLKNLKLNDQSILRFQAKFENLPNSNDRKGVTLAQIHNDAQGVGRPLFRVEYTGENELRAVLTDTYIKYEGESTNDYLVGFRDGHELYCKLEILESGNQISVYVKNINTGKSKTKIYTVDNKWLEKDGDFYFKTGAYLQVAGKAPRVSYYSLKYSY